MQYGEVQDYWLYKGTTRIAVLSANELTYTDELDIRNEGEVFTCYRVLANIKITYPDGSFSFTQSQSNKDCATQGSNIHVPNALSANGVNNKFRPIIVFGRSINSYNMKIYDRYGAQIFESKDLYNAWDGTKDGQPIKQGMYVYFIRYQGPDGKWIERKGTVMLVR
jgi:gliding motility-associated-like protein